MELVLEPRVSSVIAVSAQLAASVLHLYYTFNIICVLSLCLPPVVFWSFVTQATLNVRMRAGPTLLNILRITERVYNYELNYVTFPLPLFSFSLVQIFVTKTK